MFKPVAKSAKKSLSLAKDSVFKLLFVMTVLLGWLLAVGSGAFFSLENLYKSWQLQQSSQLSVYLLAESPEQRIQQTAAELETMRGVVMVDRLSKDDTKALLSPYFEKDIHFPLPIILDVHVNADLNRELFNAKVYKAFPEAEIDDARNLLSKVSRAVSLAQMVTLGLAGILFVVMALLVSLTVKAGLRGQKESLSVLQYVGATDAFIVKLVVRQVFVRSFLGWLFASLLAALTIFATATFYPEFEAFTNKDVYIAVALAPLSLVFVAFIAAWFTSFDTIGKAEKSA